MATLVAPNTVRFSIIGSYLTKPCINTLDMVVIDDRGLDQDRHEAILDAANALLDGWAEFVTPLAQESYAFNEVRWIDLDTPTGETGSLSSTGTYSLPENGAGSGEPYTAAVAVLVTKQTSRQRGLRTGRFFLAPPDETNITGNILSPAFLSLANGNLGDFLEAITETGDLTDYYHFPTVVHTRNAGTPSAPNIVYAGNTQITSLDMNGRVSTQRRRNRP